MSEQSAMRARIAPEFIIAATSAPARSVSTKSAVLNGIKTSKTVSINTRMGVSILAFLNSLMLFASTRMICIIVKSLVSVMPVRFCCSCARAAICSADASSCSNVSSDVRMSDIKYLPSFELCAFLCQKKKCFLFLPRIQGNNQAKFFFLLIVERRTRTTDSALAFGRL